VRRQAAGLGQRAAPSLAATRSSRSLGPWQWTAERWAQAIPANRSPERPAQLVAEAPVSPPPAGWRQPRAGAAPWHALRHTRRAAPRRSQAAAESGRFPARSCGGVLRPLVAAAPSSATSQRGTRSRVPDACGAC
jgi:hypothetical protein